MLLQMAIFHSFLWLSNIPLCVCVCVCVCVDQWEKETDLGQGVPVCMYLSVPLRQVVQKSGGQAGVMEKARGKRRTAVICRHNVSQTKALSCTGFRRHL